LRRRHGGVSTGDNDLAEAARAIHQADGNISLSGAGGLDRAKSRFAGGVEPMAGDGYRLKVAGQRSAPIAGVEQEASVVHLDAHLVGAVAFQKRP
jgi:hypothetical protein